MEYNERGGEIMRDYNRNNKSGGGRRPGGSLARRGGGSFQRNSGRREMHKAVCDECGKDCEVPFRPSGGKPIFCSDCFEKKNGGGSRRLDRRGSGGSDFGKRDNTNKQLLEQVSLLNTKLDRIIEVLEGSVKKKVVKKAKVASKDEKVETKKVSKKEAKKSTT